MAADTMTTTAPAVPDVYHPGAHRSAPVVVASGWRDPQRSRWIQTLTSALRDPSSPTRHVAAIRPPAIGSGALSGGVMLRELLFALGKSPHVTSGSEQNSGDLDVPAAWLLARRTSELVVLDAQQLSPSANRTLIELAAAVGARIWLIGHEPSDGLDEIVERYGADHVDLDDFDRIWRRPDRLPDLPVDQPPTERRTNLPCSCALTFRADCRRLLPDARFREIDRVYVREFRHAMGDMSSRGAGLDHEAVGGLLRRRIRAAHSIEDVVVTARAIEAAGLRHGMQISIDVPELINAAERNPRPGRLTSGDAAAVDAYARPDVPAICVLGLIGLAPDAIREVAVGQVPLDASTVESANTTLEVPEVLRPLLAAQRLCRAFTAAADDAPLLANADGTPYKLHLVTRLAKIAEVEVGVRLGRARFDRKALTTFQWLAAHGLAVHKIGEPEVARRTRK